MARSGVASAFALAAIFAAGCAPGPIVSTEATRSSIDAPGKNHDLLYVGSKTENTVSVYPFPKYKNPILTIDVSPNGLCAGSNGSMWISTSGSSTGKVSEYARGSQKVIREVSASAPAGCAFDATSGALAVANTGSKSTPGSLAIYAHGGKPKVYTDPNMYDVKYCTYDGSGDVFISGDRGGTNPGVVVAELKKGSNAIKELALGSNIPTSAGAIEWDGQYIVLSDASSVAFYRFSIAKSKVKYVDTLEFPIFQSNRYSTTSFLIDQGNLVMSIENGIFYEVDTVTYPYGYVFSRYRNIGHFVNALALSQP